MCLSNCRYDVVRHICDKFNYREVGDVDNWNLYWTDLSISIERCKDMKRYQKINHFPGMLEICRKDLLARNLKRMQRAYPKDYTFFPRTWCLPADFGDALTYSRMRKNKTFILKPDAGSQGRGITLTRNLKDVKPTERLVCQVYISRPYLIDGYKFDLRIYTLITSCDPLRIYVYREGLVRFATSKYKEPNSVNVSNVYMHLTNYAVNKHSKTYSTDNECGSKRKLSWLYGYLKSLGHDVEKLCRSIDGIIVKTILSSWPVLKHSYTACFPNHDIFPACCELLGVDIILDKRLYPILLEVNHSPSFHTDTDLDLEVKESVLTDMFKMINLENCDKRKIMREDKKRVRDRLLQTGSSCVNNDYEKQTDEHSRHEMRNRGGFRAIYPSINHDKSYNKFFNQTQCSLYCDTLSSKARETAQIALRDEMLTRAKEEELKRIPLLKHKRDSVSNEVPSPLRPNSVVSAVVKNSFEPQMIVESEEKERLLRLSQRDYLVRSNGLLEYLYFSMKLNGHLRPQDERKYAIYDKIKSINDGTSGGVSKCPAISDLLEAIKFEGSKMMNLNRSMDSNTHIEVKKQMCP